MEYKNIENVKKLQKSVKVKTIGKIIGTEVLSTKKGDNFVQYIIEDKTKNDIKCNLFNSGTIDYNIGDDILIEGKYSYFYNNINIEFIELKNKKKIPQEISEKEKELIKNNIKNFIFSMKNDFLKNLLNIYFEDESYKNNLFHDKNIKELKIMLELVEKSKKLFEKTNYNINLIYVSIILKYIKETFILKEDNNKIVKEEELLLINDFNILKDRDVISSKFLTNCQIISSLYIKGLEEKYELFKLKGNQNIETMKNEIKKLNKNKDKKQIEYFTDEINLLSNDIESKYEEIEKEKIKKHFHIHKILILILFLNGEVIEEDKKFIEYKILENLKNLEKIVL